MANLVTSTKTNLSSEEVITRAIQFFTTEKWRATTQSARSATFEGKPPIPWLMIILMIIGFLMFFIPGIILYIFVFRKIYRFQNLVITASPIEKGTEVVITYPKYAKKMVGHFLDSLPQL